MSEEAVQVIGGENVPAIYVNRFVVAVGVPVCRIAFGETVSPGGEIHYRAAISLTTDDALELARLINKLHEKHMAKMSGQQESGGDAG